MFKKYIFILLFLSSGCLQFQGPFQDTKTPLMIDDHKIFGIYIPEIIGLPQNTSIKFQKLISSNLRENNIISSEKIINENSFILLGTLIKLKAQNKNILIWNFRKKGSKKSISFKTEIDFPLNFNYENINFLSNDVSEKLLNYIIKPKIIKNLFIREINIFDHDKQKEMIFLQKFEEIIKTKNLNISIKTKKEIEKLDDKTRILDIKIINNQIEDIDNIKVIWNISYFNDKNIGKIKQSKKIKKGLIEKFWSQIAQKILEMAIVELNYLTWVD